MPQMEVFLFAALVLAPPPATSGNLPDLPSPGDLVANVPSLPEVFNILSKLYTTIDIRLRPHVAIDVVRRMHELLSRYHVQYMASRYAQSPSQIFQHIVLLNYARLCVAMKGTEWYC